MFRGNARAGALTARVQRAWAARGAARGLAQHSHVCTHSGVALFDTSGPTIRLIAKYGGCAFAVWTIHEEWLFLRNPNPETASPIYVELLKDLRRCMRRCEGTRRQGLLFFDNRGRSEDVSAASAIQNFIARNNRDWARRFMQTPHFTVSAVSPGLQAADLIAYLAAHQQDTSVRPELVPYWEQVERIAFRRQRLALRAVNGQ